MGIADMKSAKGQTGEKLPKGVNASDASGERKQSLKGGVAQGKADGLGLRAQSEAGRIEGQLGECKGGRKESCVYDHKRVEHAQD